VSEKNALSTTPVLRFGVFQVNLAARELRKHGVRVRLPGQPFCILSLLLEKPGEVVTRKQIREKLWTPDTFVDFEHSLNSSMKKLRAALGDSPESARYIETLPRQGYRFIAPVEEIPAISPSVPTSAPVPNETGSPDVPRRAAGHWLTIVVVAALSLTVIAGYFLWSRAHLRPQQSSRMIVAVLPFENLTGDAGQDYLSDGLTDEMIAQLGRLDPQRLGVISRTSAMHYKNKSMPVDKIGRELGVQYVLEGSVRRDPDTVRISAQLIQARDQAHLWSRQYDRELNSLLSVQGEIAQEIADEIGLTLASDNKGLVAGRKPSASPNSYEAYDLYLKGRFFWNKRTKDGFQQAASYFQESIAKDSKYARAYAGLADTFALMSTWALVRQNEFLPKARAAALKALQIDDTLAEAHASLALIAENYDYDWQTAEKEFRRAIQLDPQYATAHQWYAECLSLQGRFDEALAESERARQLDPLSLIIATDHAAILYFSRQYDRAIEQFRVVQAMDPDFTRTRMVVFAYVEKEMFTEALAEAKKWHHSDGTPCWEAQAFVYGRAGKRRSARQELTQWEQWHRSRRSPTTFAPVMAYIAAGRNDDAIALLQRSYVEHSSPIMEIKVASYYDPLRADRRFQDLLRRVHFVQ
jgi:TolB-like protein/DNA-binding winged helix-turn-helix (wHTH) protein